MYRYWTFRILSLLIGIGLLIFLINFEIEIGEAVVFSLVSIFFFFYGLSPSLIKKFFKINPDEDVIVESKRDFELIKRLFRKK